MVWAALKEAKSKNLPLATIWLDIANAYRSIPLELIIFALYQCGVSPKWIHLIETYYSGIFSKSFSQEAPSSWHMHQRGPFNYYVRTQGERGVPQNVNKSKWGAGGEGEGGGGSCLAERLQRKFFFID